jgi:hypothetical protein
MNKHPKTQPSRRRLLRNSLALLAGSALLAACQERSASAEVPKAAAISPPAPLPVAAGMSTVSWIEVWKTPTCGCCQAWVEHLQREGFTVKANDVPQTAPIRTKLGIPDDMGSCHTALIAGFAIEGHVPASEIRRLLAEPESLRQQVIGLSVPGMPIGSPGMEMGTKRDKFDVMLVLKGGKSRVYQSYSYIA